MSIITIANLKGGVGKTALAVNVAHAFSKRFCECLLLDLDPQADASRLLMEKSADESRASSEMARPSLHDLFSRFVESCRAGIQEVRPGLSVLSSDRILQLVPGGKVDSIAELGDLIPRLIEELSNEYDNIIIDTPPTWGAVHQATIQCADLVCIPIDPSEMSVRAAIGLLNRIGACSPSPALLVRTLVNRKATSITRHSLAKLEAEFSDGDSEILIGDDRPPKRVMLRGLSTNQEMEHRIFLSHTPVYRSEQVQRTSYQHKTVYENVGLRQLQASYSRIAQEIELVLASEEAANELLDDESDMRFAVG